MDDLKKRLSVASDPSRRHDRAVDRFIDALVFVGFLSLSVFAIAAVAVVTPVVLALSMLVGLFEKNADVKSWRPANA